MGAVLYVIQSSFKSLYIFCIAVTFKRTFVKLRVKTNYGVILLDQLFHTK